MPFRVRQPSGRQIDARESREIPAARIRWQIPSEIALTTSIFQMPTVLKEIDGEEKEVEVSSDDLPDGQVLMSKDTLNEKYVDADYHENEIERIKNRFDNDMRRDVREELKEDESFRKEVAAEVGMDEEERKKIVQEVEENKVQPLQNELQTWKQQTKREKILNAFQNRDDADPKALQSIGNADPLVVQALEDRVIETDDRRFVMGDGNGNPLPGEDGGYASIAEGIDQLAEDEDYQPLFREEEPSGGSGFNGSGSPGSSASDWEEMSQREIMDYVEEHGRHPRYDAQE